MKKIIAGIILSLFLSFSLVRPAFAQSQTTDCQPNDTRQECNATVGGVELSPDDIIQAINAPTPNLANTTAYVFYTISVLINGTFDPSTEALPKDGSTPKEQAYYPGDVNQALSQGGAIGGVGYLISEMIVHKPASAQTYVADIMQNSRFGVQPAYAQGIGFAALTPILGTWKAFRDMAYYLLTVMFLVTGILILVRHKISSNMAVTVQNALPRLVITLIVITFSYAIAGAIVDIMFLALNFIVNVFQGQIFEAGDINPTLGDVRNLAFNTHIFTFTLDYVFGSPGSHNSNAWEASRSVGQIVYNAISSASGLSAAFGDNGFFANLFTGILQLIFAIIFGIALLIAMFRVFFALIMSYAGFIINVVMSPLILLQGAIPGKDPFQDWIKNLVAGLAPFVVVVFMILMSLALTGAHTKAGIGYDQAAPADSGLRLPLILAGQIPAESFLGILGMGFMLLLPNAVDIAKKVVGAKGGIMDEYKDKAFGNFQKGWKGDQIIPGIGATNIGAQRLLVGSSGSRGKEDKKSQGERTIGSRLGNYGAIGGALSIGKTAISTQLGRYQSKQQGYAPIEAVNTNVSNASQVLPFEPAAPSNTPGQAGTPTSGSAGRRSKYTP